MDANGDGKVSLQEMQQRRLAKTMRLDANGDGRLTRAEFAQVMAQRFQSKGMDAARAQAKAGKMFAKADANGDGFVTPDEIRKVTAKRFARMDNGSGYIPATAGRHARAMGGYEPAPSSVQPPAPQASPR
jgi:Ca2+-binding EF-hand superfamily protein